MNQTKKRLSIIKTAISMTDIETIRLQMLKLEPSKADAKIKEIIVMLQGENYAQAQALINDYIDHSSNEIFQRTSQSTSASSEKKEFNLFDNDYSKEKERDYSKDAQAISRPGQSKEITDLNEFIDPVPEAKKMTTQEHVNYDSLLNIEADDILSKNIELDISENAQDELMENATTADMQEEMVTPSTIENKPQEAFASGAETLNTEEQNSENINHSEDDFSLEENTKTEEDESKDTEEEASPLAVENNEESYAAIRHIDIKFKNMCNQYYPKETSDEDFPSVNAWLTKISNEGYTSKEIEEVIAHINKLISENKAEAAQLLLVTAATESKFARLILGRELYKNNILKENIPESFTIINNLAVYDKYPEALCDLGQFYENGIGTIKDTKEAERLYAQAVELGIYRAEPHLERVKEENNSFFSFLKMFNK